jgi:hypothetical protein
VEEQTILVLIQIVEANGTLQPMHDSRKSNEDDGAVVIAASRWPGLLVFFVIIVLLLGHLVLRKGTSLAFKDSLYLKCS